uniref:Uncharacterized protein n=2 Tax=Anas TaxID=8835 RepID=A0A8B9VDP7_9AVES
STLHTFLILSPTGQHFHTIFSYCCHLYVLHMPRRFLICLKHTAFLPLDLCKSFCKDLPAWVRSTKPHFFTRPPPVDTLAGLCHRSRAMNMLISSCL